MYVIKTEKKQKLSELLLLSVCRSWSIQPTSPFSCSRFSYPDFSTNR